MEPICPKCFNNSFKIFNRADGKAVSKCMKCGSETMFEETKPVVAREELPGQTPAPPE